MEMQSGYHGETTNKLCIWRWGVSKTDNNSEMMTKQTTMSIYPYILLDYFVIVTWNPNLETGG